MSRSDNTAKKFDTNSPAWLILKLAIKQDEQSSGLARQTSKHLWRREIEMELNA